MANFALLWSCRHNTAKVAKSAVVVGWSGHSELKRTNGLVLVGFMSSMLCSLDYFGVTTIQGVLDTKKSANLTNPQTVLT